MLDTNIQVAGIEARASDAALAYLHNTFHSKRIYPSFHHYQGRIYQNAVPMLESDVRRAIAWANDPTSKYWLDKDLAERAEYVRAA